MNGLGRLSAEAARAGALMRRLQVALAPAVRVAAERDGGTLLGGEARLEGLTRSPAATPALERIASRLGMLAEAASEAEPAEPWPRRGAPDAGMRIAGASPAVASATFAPRPRARATERHALGGAPGDRAREAAAVRRAFLEGASGETPRVATRGDAGGVRSGLAGDDSSGGRRSRAAPPASSATPRLGRATPAEPSQAEPSRAPAELVSAARASELLRERARRVHALGGLQSVVGLDAARSGAASQLDGTRAAAVAGAAAHAPDGAGRSRRSDAVEAGARAPAAFATGVGQGSEARRVGFEASALAATGLAATSPSAPSPLGVSRLAAGAAALPAGAPMAVPAGAPTAASAAARSPLPSTAGGISGLRRLAALATEALDEPEVETDRSHPASAAASVEDELNRLLCAEALRHGLSLGVGPR